MNENSSTLQLKEEYELWRKNCRFMYDTVSETALTWPSLTVQWLPKGDEGDDAKLLLGTHTSGKDDNYLKLATTKFNMNFANQPNAISSKSSKIKIAKKIKTASEINRARHMPQDPNLIATIDGSGSCEILNLKSESADAQLSPHKENGYGLSWNAFRLGVLLTASDDMTCAVFDINKASSNSNLIDRYRCHNDIVNDARWHAFDVNMFGSVSDDRIVRIFDTRTQEKPVQSFYDERSGGINSLAFSSYSRNLVALGNQNSNINFLDLRAFPRADLSGGTLHTMMGHGDAITSMEFSPHSDGILASGSQDRRVILWDLSKIGEEQTQEDAEDGAPEILMMHAGHTGSVTDLSWCPYQDWTLASTADDNILHLWKISDTITKSEECETKTTHLE